MDSETCHFWAGTYASIEDFTGLFVETYSDDDDTPISPFAETQRETFYDHDFLEYGYSDDSKSLEELVQDYSYSDEWLQDFKLLVESLMLTHVNAFVFITDAEIGDPQDIESTKGNLRYLGTISYNI